jgi:hypothetical protein
MRGRQSDLFTITPSIFPAPIKSHILRKSPSHVATTTQCVQTCLLCPLISIVELIASLTTCYNILHRRSSLFQFFTFVAGSKMVCWPCGQIILDYEPGFCLHQNQKVRKSSLTLQHSLYLFLNQQRNACYLINNPTSVLLRAILTAFSLGLIALMIAKLSTIRLIVRSPKREPPSVKI